MPNVLETIAELPDEMAQRRELYRQQMRQRMAAKPIEMRRAETPLEKPGTETDIATQLKGEQAKARAAAAGAQAVIEKMKAGDIGGAIEAGIAAAAEVGGQLLTAQILKFMWLHVYWVLPMLYINFHFIMRYVAGQKTFCRFSEEWMPASKIPGGRAGGPIGGGAGKGIGEALSFAQEAPQRGLEILEFCAWGLANGILALIIAFIVTVVYFVVHPCDALAITVGGGEVFKWIIGALGKINGLCE
ncbi:MAG: hypothetical protein ACP5IX_00765 [Patescibacteria group bacterium]